VIKIFLPISAGHIFVLAGGFAASQNKHGWSFCHIL
jgi:hypothetical protein